MAQSVALCSLATWPLYMEWELVGNLVDPYELWQQFVSYNPWTWWTCSQSVLDTLFIEFYTEIYSHEGLIHSSNHCPLLIQGAEINSRTGSKLGISPLMLAAMNGHAATVKLLLDMGSDINAQIETNRNTALTLACFQGRCEVVSLLLDRKANVEHRAKTGLTPLMEAASGGYVEVGRILLDKGADVNAPPVPSSRDTALTIAADKGHYRFVELLIKR